MENVNETKIDLKIGDVLICIKSIKMTETKEIALIKGKEYVINGFFAGMISVESEIDFNHYFNQNQSKAHWTKYFIKK